MAARTEAAAQAFVNSLDDDLNTAEALAAAFEYARDANSAMDAASSAPTTGPRRCGSSSNSMPFSTC